IEAAGRGASGLGLSYAQIDAILELQLHRLTQLSIDEILKELKSIRDLIAELREILASDRKLKQVIIGELREVHKAYGDDRRTQIVDKVDEIKLEDLIADTDMLITVSHAGYIKRTPVEVYRHQSRGGKGRIGARTKEEDFVEYLFIASAHSYILLFTSKGRVYWLKVYELPEAAAATRGKAIASLVKFQEDEKLTALVAATNLEEEGRFVFMAEKRHSEKNGADGIFQPALHWHHRHQPRGQGRTDWREAHRQQADDFPRQPRRPGHPVSRDGSAPHGPQRRRRERHGPGQGGLRGQHGRRAAGFRDHRQGIPADHAKPGRAGKRTHQGLAHHADAHCL